MQQLLGLFAYLSVVSRGVLLSLQTLLVGGVSFLVLIVPPSMREAHSACERVEPRIRQVLFWCCIALATTQILYAASNSFILMSTAGLRFREVVGAQFFVASSAIVAASAVLATVLRRRQSMWCAIGLVLIVLLGSVATGHAWSRMDHRLTLAVLDLLHQAAAGVWIGGLPILLIALANTKNSDLAASICQRFSRMAIAGVGIVLLAGIGMVWFYFDSLSAVYGTSYGVMLLGKLGLFLVLVGIGASNKSIIARLNSDISRLQQYLRRNIEAEIGIGLTVLLAAASLTSQPPAIDLPNDRVTLHEAGDHLAPRWPRFSSPDASQLSQPERELQSREAEKAARASAYVPGLPTHPENPADRAWSEYNHNWAGLLVLAIGILAVASQSARVRWARHWPLLFIGLAVFLQIRADPENWPLGPHGFWESFLDPEVLQHRVFVLLIVAFAIYEWRVQTRRSKYRWQSFAFPVACALGGALLFAHTHALGNIKAYTLIEWNHVPLAFLAVMAGWSRWAELRTGTGKQAKLVWVWSACLVMIGSLLMFYREP